ncbi:histidine ABC transporter permease HisM [Pseudomonas helleri]|uniref:histidine ABC transporter permease HisM n=1 Tax=Pseudomonas helleri TaxID=1608996 RepID=UPI003FD34DB1
MNDILQTYWQAYLWWDGFNYSGLLVTMELLVLSLLVGAILSFPLSILRCHRSVWVYGPVWLFTYIFRGAPLYIQLLIIYSGVYQLDFVRTHPWLDGFFKDGFKCAILALGLNATAYTTEMLAGTIKSISRGEVEAANAYGFSKLAIYKNILIPAAFRRALPAYSNEVILMLHATAIAFTVTVPDLLKVAGDVNSDTYQAFYAYGIAAVIYLSVTLTLIGGFRLFERHVLKSNLPRAH